MISWDLIGDTGFAAVPATMGRTSASELMVEESSLLLWLALWATMEFFEDSLVCIGNTGFDAVPAAMGSTSASELMVEESSLLLWLALWATMAFFDDSLVCIGNTGFAKVEVVDGPCLITLIGVPTAGYPNKSIASVVEETSLDP